MEEENGERNFILRGGASYFCRVDEEAGYRGAVE